MPASEYDRLIVASLLTGDSPRDELPLGESRVPRKEGTVRVVPCTSREEMDTMAGTVILVQLEPGVEPLV